MFSDKELERLRRFPEIGRNELFRFFTPTPADVACVDPARGRGAADQLGLSVALRTLPWLGFVPDQVSGVPPVAVARLADQLNLNPGELRSYDRRAKTRTEHLGPAGILSKGASEPARSPTPLRGGGSRTGPRGRSSDSPRGRSPGQVTRGPVPAAPAGHPFAKSLSAASSALPRSAV
ncbi:hypothetical protein GCM10009654_64660 [Streptomyces hebeiensis]|uniref:DUF4158 domain-containing protein n=1 Tax=Streptomyces hebeiensis TaxID=229486 RepID=A0ABP4FWF8_9ACTN